MFITNTRKRKDGGGCLKEKASFDCETEQEQRRQRNSLDKFGPIGGGVLRKNGSEGEQDSFFEQALWSCRWGQTDGSVYRWQPVRKVVMKRNQ